MDRRTLLKGMTLVAAAGPRVALADAKSNSLRWASTPPITAVDPYYNAFREATIIHGQMVWDTLVYRSPDSGDFEPLLAKSWRWSSDTTLELELRDDVQWHDGKPLSADDVVYTVNYVSDPTKKISVQSNVNWMKGAEKTGELGVRLHLKQPFAPAMHYLSALVHILPNGFFGPNGEAGAGGRLVGTGPFRIVKFTPGSSIDYERFDGYFSDSPKGSGHLKTITYRTIPDQATQIAELLSGGLDWIWAVPRDQAERIRSLPNLTVVPAETMRFSLLSFNTREMDIPNPTKDRRVREAIACAVDREAIIQHIVGEGASVVRSACFRTQFGCTQDVAQYSYDPERAKALLAEAGYADGVTLELCAWRSREWTEAVASYLEAVGIKTNVSFQEYSAIRTRVTENKSIHMFLTDHGSSSINDVAAVLNYFFTLSADDMAQDKGLAEMVTAAGSTIDESARKALYDKALNRIADEVYWLPLWNHATIFAYAKDLDFKAYSDENPRFYSVKWK